LEMWIALGAFQLKRRRNPFDGTWAKHMFGL
jgi:hypothetical protein